ncbi:MAG: FkbM family methyltransferase [Betaproteobacteria bacterium]|nr:FkbM family methyltransferase [Betaproteobacteria bacterium]
MSNYLRNLAVRLLLPTLRAYIRFCPVSFGKTFLYTRIVDRYFCWRTFQSISSTKARVRMHTCLPDQIQSRIYFFGVWEPQITAFVRERLTPGDIFIDVGANVGYYALLAASLVGDKGTVLAVEASPSIFGLLKDNVSLNGFANIELFNEAASDRPGFLEIFLAPDSNIGATTTVASEAVRKGYTREAQVRARTLSAIVGKDRLLDARLIKMDVEGAEASVIKGIRSFLPQLADRTEWIFEVSPRAIRSQGSSPDELLDSFRISGYKLYQIKNDYSDSDYLSSRIRYELTEFRGAPDERVDLVASKMLSLV